MVEGKAVRIGGHRGQRIRVRHVVHDIDRGAVGGQVRGQVGHQNRWGAVHNRPAEHPAPGVGVAENEVAFGLAFGIVAECIQAVPIGQVEAQVAEEFIVVLYLRRTEDLRRRPTYLVIAGGDQIQCVAALHAATGLVNVHELEAEVGKAGSRQRQADVARNTHFVAVAVIVLAPASFQQSPLGVVAQHKIQRTGNGVGTILRRSTVTQHFQPLERNGRDYRNISTLRSIRNAAAQEGDH